MASGDARPMPRKNVAFRVTLPIFDADGDLVTGAAGLDSEVSKDGAAFADCTNEATEIGSTGIYYLDLTSTEMNADTVVVIVKTSTTGAKTTPIIMYPEESGDIRVNVDSISSGAITSGAIASGAITPGAFSANAITDSAVDPSVIFMIWDEQMSGHTELGSFGQRLSVQDANLATAGSSSTITTQGVGTDDYYNGSLIVITGGTGNGQVRIITDYVGATKVATVSPNWATNPDNTSEYMIIPFATLSVSAASIADAVWDEDATGHQTQGTFGQVLGDSGADSDTIWGLVNTNLNATISSRASQTSVDAIDDFVDTEIATIISTLGTPAGASISADIAAIESQTDDIGALGAGLTAIPWNSAWDAEVQSEVQDALEVNNLDHLVKIAVDTNFATTVHLDSVLGQMADDGTSATFDRTTDSLEALAVGGGGGDVNVVEWAGVAVATPHTAGYPVVTIKDGAGTGELNTDNGQVIVVTNNDKTGYSLSNTDRNTLVDAIWDEDIVSAHGTAGTPGLIISELTKRTVTLSTAVADGSVVGQLLDDGTEVYDRDTDSLQAIADNATVVPAADVADAVWDELRSGHVVSGSFGENVLASVITDGISNTSISSTALAEIADVVWDEPVSGHLTDGTFGTMLQPIYHGTLDAANPGDVTFPAGASSVNDFYNIQLLVIIDGTGAGQARLITDYVGLTKVATMGEDFTVTPDNTSKFVVYPFSSETSASAGIIADAVWDELRSAHTTPGSFGEGVSSVQGNVTGDVEGDVIGNVNATITSLDAGSITSATFATGAIDSNALADSAVDKIWDAVIESTMSFKEALRLMLSSLAGKSSGGGTTNIKFRDLADSKDRINATVDSNGNRTSVTRDAT